MEEKEIVKNQEVQSQENRSGIGDSHKETENRFRKYFSAAWEILKITALAVIIVVPVRYFIFQPFIVKGESMFPSLEPGDYLIIDEISYRFSDPQRGDIIVFKYPLDQRQHFIKRIIGLPGETVVIEKNRVEVISSNKKIPLEESGYIPDLSMNERSMEVVLGEDEYFVMGDNRQFSYDSRRWGALTEEDIVGKALIRLFPVANISLIKSPAY